MTPEISLLSERLHELNIKCDVTKNLIEKNLMEKYGYIHKNEINKMISYRLSFIKREHEQLRELLHNDFFKHSVNADKRRIILSHRIQEFHEKNNNIKVKYDNLAFVSQLQELTKSNEKLYSELSKESDMLEQLHQAYIHVHSILERRLVEKIIEFCNAATQ